MSTALLTDHYELTMVDAARASGRGERNAVFEVFARHLPAGRRYGVVAGTHRLIDAIQEFRFGPEELAFLAEHAIVSPDTLEWLGSYRFGGTIRGYAEGELYFPGSPILSVEGTFQEAVLLETLILSVLNYDCAVASAASRMVRAAESRPLIEMGARRANERSAVAAARAAYIAGFDATSNLEAGRTYGIPTKGTAAHSFTLVHDSEEEAFRAQIAAMGTGTTLLIDTYDIEAGVNTAIKVAGVHLGAVRIDSGDLPVVVRAVRDQLDSLGAKATKIVVTNDLNEHTIAGLRGAPVDVFGVGTSVVTGSGSPAVGLVYKLVERTSDTGEWIHVAKRSSHKGNPGGKKEAYRDRQGQVACEEIISADPELPLESSYRPLLTTLIDAGEVVTPATPHECVEHARAHHQVALAELPPSAFSLSAGEPAIPTRVL
ncbi:nicotinate phosphoribosyltransferase [Pontimonas sp.]|nr:nicotinate phosphoribosyltransferase [Pontimonas sp.]